MRTRAVACWTPVLQIARLDARTRTAGRAGASAPSSRLTLDDGTCATRHWLFHRQSGAVKASADTPEPRKCASYESDHESKARERFLMGVPFSFCLSFHACVAALVVQRCQASARTGSAPKSSTASARSASSDFRDEGRTCSVPPRQPLAAAGSSGEWRRVWRWVWRTSVRREGDS